MRARGCLSLLVVAGFALSYRPALRAEGSPPLITDDPGTPGNGHWEINLGASTERRPDVSQSELPLFDVNYGLGEAVQLTFEVPYLIQSANGQPRLTGLGNSEVAVKWRFHDTGEGGLVLSIFPRIVFNTPGSSAADHGLVNRGSHSLLSVQLGKRLGLFTLNLQLGQEFHPECDQWIYGAALSRHVNPKVEIAGKLAGSATARLNRSQLAPNFGVVVDLSERVSLMFSAGRERHNHDEPRASVLGYTGWQFRL